MKMFAKKLLVSFTAIVLVFTSCTAYNHAEELPKFPFFDTPGSSDIPHLSLGVEYDSTKFPWDPWHSGYIPFIPVDSSQEFSLSQAQQPPLEVEDPVFRPAGLGLNGWGRVPRVSKFGHRGAPHFRLPPKRPSVPPPKVWSPRVQPPPNQAPPRKSPPPPVRTPPPPPAWTPPSPPVTVQPPTPAPTIQPPSPTPTPMPTIQPPSPTPMGELSPFDAPTPVTESPSLNPAKPPFIVLDPPAIPPEWENYPTEPPTVMW